MEPDDHVVFGYCVRRRHKSASQRRAHSAELSTKPRVVPTGLDSARTKCIRILRDCQHQQEPSLHYDIPADLSLPVHDNCVPQQCTAYNARAQEVEMTGETVSRIEQHRAGRR